MTTHANIPNNQGEINVPNNDITPYGDDTLGENTGSSGLEIDALQEQNPENKHLRDADDPRAKVATVIPDNDN